VLSVSLNKSEKITCGCGHKLDCIDTFEYALCIELLRIFPTGPLSGSITTEVPGDLPGVSIQVYVKTSCLVCLHLQGTYHVDIEGTDQNGQHMMCATASCHV